MKVTENYMNASEFKQRLAECAPATADLEKLGLSKDDVEQFRRSFFIPARTTSAKGVSFAGELGSLLEQSDLSEVEIGMVRFFPEPEKRDSNWAIGQVEADPLVVDSASGEVYVEDLTAAQKYILWRCAKDGESLLSALLTAACFLGRCLYDEALANDERQKSVCVDACVKVAGGEIYRPFYMMLIGL
jgi:hypothetical protein